MTRLETIKRHARLALEGDERALGWLEREREHQGPDATDLERAWLAMGIVSAPMTPRVHHDDFPVSLLFEAFQLIDHADDPNLWLRVSNTATMFYIEAGDWYSTLLVLLKTLRHIDDIDAEVGDVARALSTIGWLLVQLGQPEQAAPYIRRALSFAVETHRITDTYSDLIESLVRRDLLDEAERELEAFERLELPHTTRSREKSLIPRALVAWGRDRHEEVIALTARGDWTELLSGERALLHALSAHASFELGRVDDVLERTASGIQAIDHQPGGDTYSLLVTTRARALASLGRVEDMLTLLLEYDAHQRERNTSELGANVVGLITDMEREVHQLRHVELEASNAAYRGVNARLEAEIQAREDAEEQMRHATMLHAAGELAAGLAHDLNNLLVVIYSCVGLLEEEVDPEQLPLVHDISLTADRAAQLVRRLMALSNQPAQEPERVEIAALFETMRAILKHAIREEVTLTFECDEDVHAIIRPAELEQIVLNLALNAQDAIAGFGDIVIRVDAFEGAARMRVSDSGSGMTPEVAARAFEPFFSTKRGAHGTGLGLAVTAKLVERMEGSISIESSPGQGTTFTVTMPLDGDRGRRVTAREISEPLDDAERLTVLVVEDDVAVRSAIIKLLAQQGHRTLEAVDGLEGLELFRARSDEVDVVISDIVMPRASGVELARVILATHDEAPVILMTGYTEDERLSSLLEDRRVQLIKKPFGLRDLRRAISVAARRGEA